MADPSKELQTEDSVGRRTFSTAFRGFDQAEVRAYLELLAVEFGTLRDRIEELESELSRARTSAPEPPRMDRAALTAALGEETARVLLVAEETADELKARAEEGAARALKEAHEEATRLRSAAEAVLSERTAEADAVASRLRVAAEDDAARLRKDAEAQAEATIAAAVAQGKDMIAQAQAARERVLADLARRRKSALAQIEALRVGRERLAATFAAARDDAARILVEMAEADGEAGQVADAITRQMARSAGTGDGVAGEPAAEAEPDVEAGVEPEAEPRVAVEVEAAVTEEPATPEPVAAEEAADAAEEAAPDETIDVAAIEDAVIDVAVIDVAVIEEGVVIVDDVIVADVAGEQIVIEELVVEDVEPEPEAGVAPDAEPEDAEPEVAVAEAPSEEEVAADEPPPAEIGASGGDEPGSDAETGTGASDGAAADAGEAEGAAPQAEAETEEAPTADAPTELEHEPPKSRGPAEGTKPADGPAADLAEGGLAPHPARDRYPHDAVPVALMPDSAVGPGEPGASKVERLFARIRADRASAVEEAKVVLADAPSAPVAADAPAAPAADDDHDLEAPRSDADESYLQQRDALVEKAHAGTVRALRRALGDDSNATLERLRTIRGEVSGPDALLGTEGEHTAGWVARARPGLGQAWTAGANLVAGSAPVDEGRIGEIAERLVADLVPSLRARVASVLEAVGGDRGADTVDRINAVFREWRGRIDRAVGDAVTEAVSLGLVAALPADTPVRWVVEDADGPCPDCDDNALAGPTPLGEPFPTGQTSPPAHPGCRCVLARATT